MMYMYDVNIPFKS